MKLRILVLKTGKLSAFLRPVFNLFHSMIVDRKTQFWKFLLKRGMVSAFLVEHNVRLAGINLKRYWGCPLLRLYKKGKLFCTNDVLEGTQNQVLDIFSLSKNPWLPDTRYIELILVFHEKSCHWFDRIEYLHNQGVVYQKICVG